MSKISNIFPFRVKYRVNHQLSMCSIDKKEIQEHTDSTFFKLFDVELRDIPRAPGTQQCRKLVVIDREDGEEGEETMVHTLLWRENLIVGTDNVEAFKPIISNYVRHVIANMIKVHNG